MKDLFGQAVKVTVVNVTKDRLSTKNGGTTTLTESCNSGGGAYAVRSGAVSAVLSLAKSIPK